MPPDRADYPYDRINYTFEGRVATLYDAWRKGMQEADVLTPVFSMPAWHELSDTGRSIWRRALAAYLPALDATTEHLEVEVNRRLAERGLEPRVVVSTGGGMWSFAIAGAPAKGPGGKRVLGESWSFPRPVALGFVDTAWFLATVELITEAVAGPGRPTLDALVDPTELG